MLIKTPADLIALVAQYDVGHATPRLEVPARFPGRANKCNGIYPNSWTYIIQVTSID